MASKSEGKVATKVAWKKITRYKKEGGLALIELETHSKALLGKLVVKCLLAGKEIWKGLMRRRFDMWSPIMGGKWLSANIWLFV